MFTVAGRMFYATPGNATESFIWCRVFCFANQFVPKLAVDGAAIFGLMPGDPVEGNLAPSSWGLLMGKWDRLQPFTLRYAISLPFSILNMKRRSSKHGGESTTSTMIVDFLANFLS